MVINFKDIIVEFYSAKTNTSLKIKKACLLVFPFIIIVCVTAGLLKGFEENSRPGSCENSTSRNRSMNKNLKKHNIERVKIRIEKVDKKIKGQRKSKYELHKLCQSETDKLFEKLFEDLSMSPKYEPLFDDIKFLKCFFAKLVAKVANIKNIRQNYCSVPKTWKFTKMKDWNIKNVEAISRYSKLLYKFQSSLDKIKYLSIGLLHQLKEAITKKMDSVIKDWKKLANDMVKVIQVYKKCGLRLDDSVTVIPDDIIIPHNGNAMKKSEKLPYLKTAALVFAQMLDLKYEILKDFSHRRKCVS